jgi:lipopolysaccharide export LptBFGC system permease protein LptF
VRLLKRYFWRAVLIPTLAILGIIVGLDCLFGFIYPLLFFLPVIMILNNVIDEVRSYPNHHYDCISIMKHL